MHDCLFLIIFDKIVVMTYNFSHHMIETYYKVAILPSS